MYFHYGAVFIVSWESSGSDKNIGNFLAELRRPERKAEPHNYRNRITCMYGNRNPCNSFLMVKMASGIDHGRVHPATATNDDDVAQHDGHPANSRSCSLGLRQMSLILGIHMMFN